MRSKKMWMTMDVDDDEEWRSETASGVGGWIR
jgi:hypothetical protein